MSAQVLHFIGEYRRRVPQGLFKENDDFSAILKTIVDLDSGNVANSREAQLQSSSQDPSHERDAPRRRSRKRTSQSVLYSNFVKAELQRLLSRSEARAQAVTQAGFASPSKSIKYLLLNQTFNYCSSILYYFNFNS